jgi:hypothetical protein
VFLRNTTPEKDVRKNCERIGREVKIPVSAGLANSARLAKLATNATAPGFFEIKPGEEINFFEGPFRARTFRHRQNRQRSLTALGMLTFGHVAKLPSPFVLSDATRLTGNCGASGCKPAKSG